MAATARTRLQQAAVDLFGERGFDSTTAAEIAARAGVTERTFFRHFADKREVLFDGQAVLLEALLTGIETGARDAPPLDILFHAFRSVCPLLEANRPFSEPRQAVISATPSLQERELAKMAALAEALAQALRTRGIPEDRARLAARIGMAVLADVTLAWLSETGPSLRDRLDRAEQDLKALI
ncbi:TetR family transcriptional regulator [Pseudoroseicyclus aestuarii]|uniref:TetR family transcriptional regulator n=1 Tax=Pseudoroseicyclus aestuarii TaxID=1795041 RepID=A0A318SX05_9RHOB|nr:TetR family transcriptional regulator [Pseudoroseicyclus aestuarii]PYE85865.1 TetR family transcriptional regulator [Pseudoroseicyclus aestuarii]